MNQKIVDMVVVNSANFYNLSLLGIMLTKIRRWKEIEFILRWFSLAFILPFGAAFIMNLIVQRSFLLWVLPGFMTIFLVLEVKNGYALDLDSKGSRWIGPYLILFYVGQWGLVIYSFLVNKGGGFVTLITYLISLGATAYTFSKIQGNYSAREYFHRKACILEHCEGSLCAEREILHFVQNDRLSSYNTRKGKVGIN